MSLISKKPFFFIKKDVAWLYFLVMLFLLMKIPFYIKRKIFFDEGVYVGIAKFFASQGSYGYFESIRPLFLPFILMPLQYLPFDPLITGRVLLFILTIGAIASVYYITKKHFGTSCAQWSSLLFTASNSVIFFGGLILNDVVVFTLVLFSASLAFRKRWFLSGCLLGFSFLWKFPTLLLLIPISIYILLENKKKCLKPLVLFGIGLFIFISPYFIFNFFFYQGQLFERLFSPLINASSLIQNQTWVYNKASLWRYFLFTLIIELPIMVSVFLTLKNLLHKEKKPVLFFLGCVGIFLAYFSWRVYRFDFRYMVSIIPFLALLGGLGLSKKVKRNWKVIGIIVMFPLIVSVVFMIKEPIRTTITFSDDTNLTFTNSGFSLLEIQGKAELYPGSNLAYFYQEWYLNDSAKRLMINLNGYPCERDDLMCKNQLQTQVSNLLNSNPLVSCGYFYNEKMVVLQKEATHTISPQRCSENIDFEILQKEKVHSFVRFNNAIITPDGFFINSERLSQTIIQLNEKNVSTILSIVATDFPLNKKSKLFFSKLPKSTIFAVNPSKSSNIQEFISRFKDQTGKKIKMISLNSDYVIKNNEMEFLLKTSMGCIQDSWDQRRKMSCQRINLYTLQNPYSVILYNQSYLFKLYNATRNINNEIGIDIPALSLNGKNNEIITNLINFITH